MSDLQSYLDGPPLRWPHELLGLLESCADEEADPAALSALITRRRTVEEWARMLTDHPPSFPGQAVRGLRRLGEASLGPIEAALSRAGADTQAPLDVCLERWLNGTPDPELAQRCLEDSPERAAYRALLIRRFSKVSRLELPPWAAQSLVLQLPHGLAREVMPDEVQADWGDEVTGPLSTRIEDIPATDLDVAWSGVDRAEASPDVTTALSLAHELERGIYLRGLEQACSAFESAGHRDAAAQRLAEPREARLAARGLGEVIPFPRANPRPRLPEAAAEHPDQWAETAFRVRLALEIRAGDLCSAELEDALVDADAALAPHATGLLMMDEGRADELDPDIYQDPSAWYGIWRELARLPAGDMDLALLGIDPVDSE